MHLYQKDVDSMHNVSHTILLKTICIYIQKDVDSMHTVSHTILLKTVCIYIRKM